MIREQLAAGLPYELVTRKLVASELPDTLRWKFKYQLSTYDLGSPGNTLLTIEQPTMKQRLKILDEHGYGLPDIQAVIDEMGPLEGALDFVNWLREHFQVIILSDTFYEFAKPMMRQLGWPTLLCHKLEVNAEGKITDYKLRQKDPKRMSVKALHGLNYRVIAAGDSYNDTTMLAEAGILFHAPDNVIAEFPQFPSVQTFDALREEIVKASDRDIPLS